MTFSTFEIYFQVISNCHLKMGINFFGTPYSYPHHYVFPNIVQLNLHHYASPILLLLSENKVDLLWPASPCMTYYCSIVSRQSWLTQTCITMYHQLLLYRLKTKLTCLNPHHHVLPTIAPLSQNKVDLRTRNTVYHQLLFYYSNPHQYE